jgi:predicted xylose isomerase-like sugar epimerase
MRWKCSKIMPRACGLVHVSGYVTDSEVSVIFNAQEQHVQQRSVFVQEEHFISAAQEVLTVLDMNILLVRGSRGVWST